MEKIDVTLVLNQKKSPVRINFLYLCFILGYLEVFLESSRSEKNLHFSRKLNWKRIWWLFFTLLTVESFAMNFGRTWAVSRFSILHPYYNLIVVRPTLWKWLIDQAVNIVTGNASGSYTQYTNSDKASL